MNATTYIKIERSGRNERYKGSTTVYQVSQCFSWNGEKENFKTLDITKEQAIALAKTQSNFVEEKEQAAWHEVRMESCLPVGEAVDGKAKVWTVTILDPYKD